MGKKVLFNMCQLVVYNAILYYLFIHFYDIDIYFYFLPHSLDKRDYACEYCGKAFITFNKRKIHVDAVHLSEFSNFSTDNA